MALEIRYDGYTFNVHEIKKLPNVYRAVDLISETLEYDVFNFSVRSDAVGEQKLLEKYGLWLETVDEEGIVIDNGDFENFVYGNQVELYEDGNLKAIFYVTNIQPTNQRASGEELFKMQCVSAIGLLSRMMHLGGVYNGVTAGTIIADIMQGLPYTIDAELASEMLYGWLPVTKDSRTNLHKVLFATGAFVSRDPSGVVSFGYNRQDEAKNVPKSRTFRSGINTQKMRKSEVIVVEHGFYQSLQAEEELLYDNTMAVAASGDIITFDAPCYDYRGDGITVDLAGSGANWAKISGVGYLYGKKYIHAQREVSAVIDTTGEAEPLRITDQTLVSSLNVNGVLDRFVNYYKNAQVKTLDLIVSDEKPGDLVHFYDRRDHENTGYIASIDEYASSFWRGDAKVVTNWTPTKSGNDFQNYTIVTGADLVGGVWSVPPEMQGKRARVVLFSGGEGGQGGYAGESMGWVNGGRKEGMAIDVPGQGSGTFYVGALQDGVQRGGTGGKGGKGGASATRFINIDIEALTSGYAVSFGAGGAGGAGGTAVRDWENKVTVTEPEMGLAGQNSVFSGTSTAYGAVFRGTYINLVTGEVLVRAGEDGINGGDGGRGGYTEQMHGPFATQEEAQAYVYADPIAIGASGAGVAQYLGGSGTGGASGAVTRVRYYIGGSAQYHYYVIGNAGSGGGGGAAMGANGANGTAGYGSNVSVRYTQTDKRETYFYVNEVRLDEDDEEMTTNAAIGGDGANAITIPSKPLYTGGRGGHGGGGGGGAGQCMSSYVNWNSAGTISTRYGTAYGGKGGNGGKGGDGSDGFMIVYW